MSLVAVCSQITSGVCTGTITYSDVYLLPPDSAAMLELLLAGGFDAEVAAIGFLGIVSLWATGLGAGLIVNLIRKLRGA